MRPKAKATTPNTKWPSFELGFDTVICFQSHSRSGVQLGESRFVANVHFSHRDRKGRSELDARGWIQGHSATTLDWLRASFTILVNLRASSGMRSSCFSWTNSLEINCALIPVDSLSLA